MMEQAMRIPKFRIRTMMVAIIVVGLLVSGGIESRRLYRLSRDYQKRAARLADTEQEFRLNRKRDRDSFRQLLLQSRPDEREFKRLSDASIHRTLSPTEQSSLEKLKGVVRDLEVTAEELQSRIEWLDTLIAYCEPLKLKYQRAARYPWLPIDPDPPEPVF
jgi:outer membrane murein-binding lipoprotein Lpp